MRKPSILFLGTASSIPSQDRDNTSILIEASKEESVLIDMPGAIIHKLSKSGINYLKIKNINKK